MLVVPDGECCEDLAGRLTKDGLQITRFECRLYPERREGLQMIERLDGGRALGNDIRFKTVCDPAVVVPVNQRAQRQAYSIHGFEESLVGGDFVSRGKPPF
jgi:hypothetical protein